MSAIELRAEDVWDSLYHVKTDQERVLESLQSNNNHHFTLPLSEDYIKGKLYLLCSAGQVWRISGNIKCYTCIQMSPWLYSDV